tara:strand:+ start:15186 stop:15815 length:630 start_codon:yes stop_codon:yes gene_type:complete
VELIRQREVIRQTKLAKQKAEEERQRQWDLARQKEEDRRASIETSIKFSCLSLFPSFEKLKMKIYYDIWQDPIWEEEKSYRTIDPWRINVKLELLQEWTRTLYNDVCDPNHPITTFHFNLPLSFWIAMFREVNSVIPKQCNKRLELLNELETNNTSYFYDRAKKAGSEVITLCKKMQKISSTYVNKTITNTKLTKKLLPEHIRHVLSYL